VGIKLERTTTSLELSFFQQTTSFDRLELRTCSDSLRRPRGMCPPGTANETNPQVGGWVYE